MNSRESTDPMSPMSWYCGSQLTTTTDSSASNARRMIRMLVVRADRVIITPLGSDVLPEVYWRKHRRSPVKCRAGSSILRPGGHGNLGEPQEGSSRAECCLHWSTPAPATPRPTWWKTASYQSVVLFSCTHYIGKKEDTHPLHRATLAWQFAWIPEKSWTFFFIPFGSHRDCKLKHVLGGYTGTATSPARRQPRNVRMKSIHGRKTSITHEPSGSLFSERNAADTCISPSAQ